MSLIINSLNQFKQLRQIAQILFCLLLTTIFFGCGIRGAPVPPSNPNLFYKNYNEDLKEKEQKSEEENKFRRRYSPDNTIQKK